MNIAEGLQRIAIVLGTVTGVAVGAMFWVDFPTQARINRLAASSITFSLAEMLRASETIVTSGEVRDQVFKGADDAEIVRRACGPDQSVPGVQRACQTHAQATEGLEWDQLKHISAGVFAVVAGFCSWLLLSAVLVWVGRGFVHPTAPPPSA